MTSSRYHNMFIDGAACFWTSSIVDRVPALRSPTIARAVTVIIDECRTQYQVRLIGYVVMPDHIHITVWSEKAQRSALFINRILARSSTMITSACERAAARENESVKAWLTVFRRQADKGSEYGVWKERGRGFPVVDNDVILQKLHYMHMNPVRKGLVATPEEWEFSSAAWYSNGTRLIRIDSLP